MTEKHHAALVPTHIFIGHIARSVFFAFLMILAALFMGMCGYHEFEHMPWVDAFANAAMILSGMGPLGQLNTEAGKIFAGCYALFSGLFFILIVGVMIAPIAHRFFKKINLESGGSS